MSDATSPDPAVRYRYWMREARLSEEDGHPAAARAAYAQAAEAAPTELDRAVATELGESVPTKG